MLLGCSKATDNHIVERCYAVPTHPRDRKGFSESHIRSKLEKRGWTVWRGGFLHATRKTHVYPNVAKKYRQAERILGDQLSALQYLGVVHHGMPDLLCYNQGSLKFVECKLGYESLLDQQKKTITVLINLGFRVEIHRVVEHASKHRKAHYRVKTGQRTVVDKQNPLSLYT